jgi:S-adenosyl-L-methionine hydrolase (adenosine-forming)
MRRMTTSERPIITLLTDFGPNGAAAVCHGVMLGICRDAQIVEISNSVPKYSIRAGSYVLGFALPHMPPGVHVAVVDPGVGTQRRPIALRARRGDILVGPDNGLLIPGAEALGGIAAARVLDNRDWWLGDPSSTFHGRDIFAPVAAHLAAGNAPFDQTGTELDPRQLERLAEPEIRVAPQRIDTEVTYIDSFGNVRLAGDQTTLGQAFAELGSGTELVVSFSGEASNGAVEETTRYAVTFGEVPLGSSLLYIDSSGRLAMADNQGNLAARLGLSTGRQATIRPR